MAVRDGSLAIILYDCISIHAVLDFIFFISHSSLPLPLLPGIRGTYQGLTPTIIKQGTNQAIRFFVYTNLKRYLQGGDNSKDIGNIRTFFIGGIAGAASVFGNTPVDVVKTRMQGLEAHKYKNSWDCVKKIAKNEGLKA